MKQFWFLLIFFSLIFSRPVLSFYSDEEFSANNSVGASSLDISINPDSSGLEPSATALNITPEIDILERDFSIDNDGDLDVKYKIEYENVSGAANLVCSALAIEAELNGISVYDGPMSNFIYTVNSLDSGNIDEWEFDFKLSTMGWGGIFDHLYEGNVCEFKFNIEAWQANFLNSSQGWVDVEVLDNNRVEVQDITVPVIPDLSIQNSDPLNTKNEENDIKVNITWNTDENATSKVVFDTASHGAGSWEDYPSEAPLVDDLTVNNISHLVELGGLSVSTTYYYRVISADSFGNQTSSAEHRFIINDPDNVPASTAIVMNEFLPNPVGADTALMPNGEWVELFNRGLSDVDVAGWYFEDNGANQLNVTLANGDNNQDTTDTGETIVPVGSYLVVYMNGSSFSLDDSGDAINLYDSGNNLIDTYSYGTLVGDVVSPSEGKTYARIPDGGFWVDPDGTPGEENELGDEEIQFYREMAFEKCFNEREFNDTQKDELVCNLEFLDYLGMIKGSEDLKIPQNIYDTLIEKEPEEETPQDEEIVEILVVDELVSEEELSITDELSETEETVEIKEIAAEISFSKEEVPVLSEVEEAITPEDVEESLTGILKEDEILVIEDVEIGLEEERVIPIEEEDLEETESEFKEDLEELEEEEAKEEETKEEVAEDSELDFDDELEDEAEEEVA